MKRYSFIQAIILSFYSKSLYQDVAKNWKGVSLLYLLLILSLLALPLVRNEKERVSGLLQDEASYYFKQLPVIKIVNGRASISEPVPFVILKRDNKTPFAIIDTSGQHTYLDNSEARILLTGERLYMKTFASGIQEIELEGINDLTIDRSTTQEWLLLFFDFFSLVLFPILVMILFVVHLTIAILCSFVGLRYAKKIGAGLDAQSVLRLGIVSLTPAVVLQFIHAVINIPFPFSIPLTFLVALGYLSVAIRANAV